MVMIVKGRKGKRERWRVEGGVELGRKDDG